MTTEYLNPQVNDDDDVSTITISSYVVPAGTGKKLIVDIFNEDNDSGLGTYTSVQFDGNDMELIRGETGSGSYDNSGTSYEYWLGSTTPTGDIVVSWSEETDKTMIRAYVVTELDNSFSEATAGSNSGSASTLSDNITTITDNAIILSNGTWGSNENIDPNGTGHTEIHQWNVAGGTGSMGAGYILPTTAGSYGPYGWNSDGSTSRMTNVLHAHKAAAALTTILPFRMRY